MDYVRKNFPSIRVIENGRNLGFSKGNNIGVDKARGEYVILLNNDTVVPRDFVRILSDIASHDPSIGSIGCRLVNKNSRTSYGPIFVNRGFIAPLFMGRLSHDRIELLDNIESQCIANCGAAVLFRKDAFEAMGGFDVDFWSDWEDHDLGFRLCVAGYKNLYTTKTSVLHLGRTSFGPNLSRDRNSRIIRNMLSTYLKNYEANNILTRFFLLFWIIIPIRYLIKTIIQEAPFMRDRTAAVTSQTYIALPQAYTQFLLRVPETMRKRMLVQSRRKVSDSEVFSLTGKNWIV